MRLEKQRDLVDPVAGRQHRQDFDNQVVWSPWTISRNSAASNGQAVTNSGLTVTSGCDDKHEVRAVHRSARGSPTPTQSRRTSSAHRSSTASTPTLCRKSPLWYRGPVRPGAGRCASRSALDMRQRTVQPATRDKNLTPGNARRGCLDVQLTNGQVPESRGLDGCRHAGRGAAHGTLCYALIVVIVCLPTEG